MMEESRYIGLIFKANEIDFRELFEIESDVFDFASAVAAFDEFSPREADRAAHRMHVADKEVRKKAFDILMDQSWTPIMSKSCPRVWAASWAEKTNAKFEQAGIAAQAKAWQMWIYNHIDQANGLVNPFTLAVRFWEKDVSAIQVKEIALSVFEEDS